MIARVARIVALALCVGATAAANAADPIWDAARAPGSVVVLRHSYAPGAFDPPDARLDDCSTQRNLDEAGRAQARRVGEAFRDNGVEVGTVLSSPRCRCLDTARLAFGNAEAWAPLGGALRDDDLRKRHLVAIRQRMAEHTSGPPLVLVTHGSVIGDLAGIDVRMGGFVVMRRAADGSHPVAGQLYLK